MVFSFKRNVVFTVAATAFVITLYAPLFAMVEDGEAGDSGTSSPAPVAAPSVSQHIPQRREDVTFSGASRTVVDGNHSYRYFPAELVDVQPTFPNTFSGRYDFSSRNVPRLTMNGDGSTMSSTSYQNGTCKTTTRQYGPRSVTEVTWIPKR